MTLSLVQMNCIEKGFSKLEWVLKYTLNIIDCCQGGREKITSTDKKIRDAYSRGQRVSSIMGSLTEIWNSFLKVEEDVEKEDGFFGKDVPRQDLLKGVVPSRNWQEDRNKVLEIIPYLVEKLSLVNKICKQIAKICIEDMALDKSLLPKELVSFF